jgi:hypothetical protein
MMYVVNYLYRRKAVIILIFFIDVRFMIKYLRALYYLLCVFSILH